MKRLYLLAIAGLAVILCVALCSRSKYETVDGDPLETKIYTLDNGLKVYMSVNKETPRIQTYIAVHVGGKNDPADNTGLAHYLEHIMFKGSVNYGTMDYESEKPLLEQIRELFDVYGKTTDPAQREAIYHQIDSISYEASKFAIPNEYDKMMALIGSEGSNAYTSNDVTCYIEDIPSNQIENWARVQADRFKDLVVRGFHTELEAVYEEKNMSLVDDQEKVIEKLDSMLFRGHPYGSQTVIGTQDHLKNPSITAILKQKETYYVPNNCAICLSGDFDPDNMIEIIEKYFGDWKANPNLPKVEYPEVPRATEPLVAKVYGQDAEFIMMGWRYPGESSLESETGEIVSDILYNGMAGLIDLDIVNQQRIAECICYDYGMTDHSELVLYGAPKEGQSLEEVKDLLLAEVAKLRAGDFDADLIPASVNNHKLSLMQNLTTNRRRASYYVDAFINGVDWKVAVGKLDRQAALTKEDVVAWANKYLEDSQLAVVYKYLGVDPSIKKIDAPMITPIVTNRDAVSPFMEEIQASVPQPIEPVFTDYSKDMSILESRGMEVLYKQNVTNDIANISLRYNKGIIGDPTLDIATSYLSYLGTATRTSDEIAMEMYKLACDFSVSSSDNVTYISVSGLSENIAQALDIVEDLVYNAVPDEDILTALKADIIKNRADDKLSQSEVYRAMRKYITYGADYVKATTVNNEALVELKAEDLVETLRNLALCKHSILYYGPQSGKDVLALLEAHHKVADSPVALEKVWPEKQLTPEPIVYVAHYPARQFNYCQYSDRGEGFDPDEEARITLFNEYFGGGMNAIVFQEMREARALAYSAGAWFSTPTHIGGTASFRATIASQNDKLVKAVNGFDEIINQMPRSDKALEIAKSGLISRYRTSRVTGRDVLTNFIADRDLGLSEPLDAKIYAAIEGMTMDDLEATVSKWIAGRTYHYGIVCDTNDIDMAFLRSLGTVKVVPLEEVFGY